MLDSPGRIGWTWEELFALVSLLPVAALSLHYCLTVNTCLGLSCVTLGAFLGFAVTSSHLAGERRQEGAEDAEVELRASRPSRTLEPTARPEHETLLTSFVASPQQCNLTHCLEHRSVPGGIETPHDFATSCSAEWLNASCRLIWPQVGRWLEQLFHEFESGISERLHNTFLGARVRFSKVDLGKASPCFGPLQLRRIGRIGRKKHDIEITLGMAWDSDCCVALRIGSVITVEVKKIRCQGDLSLVVCMEPEVNHPPFSSFIEVFLMNEPKLEVTFGGLAQVANLPGVLGAIKTTAKGFLSRRLVLPNCLTIDTETSSTGWKAIQPVGVMRLTLLEASNLQAQHWRKLATKPSSLGSYFGIGNMLLDPDPLVKIKLGTQTWKSLYLNKTSHPIWSEDNVAYFLIYDWRQLIEVKVYDHELYGTANNLIGYTRDVAVKDLCDCKDVFPLFLHHTDLLDRLTGMIPKGIPGTSSIAAAMHKIPGASSIPGKGLGHKMTGLLHERNNTGFKEHGNITLSGAVLQVADKSGSGGDGNFLYGAFLIARIEKVVGDRSAFDKHLWHPPFSLTVVVESLGRSKAVLASAQSRRSHQKEPRLENLQDHQSREAEGEAQSHYFEQELHLILLRPAELSIRLEVKDNLGHILGNAVIGLEHLTTSGIASGPFELSVGRTGTSGVKVGTVNGCLSLKQLLPPEPGGNSSEDEATENDVSANLMYRVPNERKSSPGFARRFAGSIMQGIWRARGGDGASQIPRGKLPSSD